MSPVRTRAGLAACALTAALILAAPPTANAQGYTLTALATFHGANGSFPEGRLVLSGGTLYGTTETGGASGVGTVFSVPVTGGTPTVLASFSGANGNQPRVGLTLSGGVLYGTTEFGGAGNHGTVFSVPVAGGAITDLATFNSTDGNAPVGDLALSADGSTLYGTTGYGGANGTGTVFSLPITGGTPTTLASLNGGPDGEHPLAGVTLSADGQTLYGTTHDGGTSGVGTVFSVPTAGGALTTLASFNGADGDGPFGDLTLVGGTLYGTTEFGGDRPNNSGIGDGTVFSVPATGGAINTLAQFNGTNGSEPDAGLILIGDTLYGTTAGNSQTSDGTAFSVPLGGGTPTVLANFSQSDANGANPQAALTPGPNGIFYGVALDGGANGDGTVFALVPSAAPEPSQSAALALGALGLGALAIKAKRRTAA